MNNLYTNAGSPKIPLREAPNVAPNTISKRPKTLSDDRKIPLTKRQREMYDFMAQFIQENGYAPTYKEISEHDGNTIGTIYNIVHELIKKGWIYKFKHRRSAYRLL